MSIKILCIFISAVILIEKCVYAGETFYGPNDGFYNNCGAQNIICAGVPKNCMKSKKCDYAMSIGQGQGHNFQINTMGPLSAELEKPYVGVVGYAPFEKSAIKDGICKLGLKLQDFRIIFYKMKNSDFGPELLNADVDSNGVMSISKNMNPCHLDSSEESFDDENSHLNLNGEFIYLVTSLSPAGKDPRYAHVPGFFDPDQYKTENGIVFYNF